MKKYKLLKSIENDSIPIGSIISLGEVIGISDPEGDIPTQRLVNQGYLEEFEGDWIDDCINEITFTVNGSITKPSDYFNEMMRNAIEKHCPKQQKKFTEDQIKSFVKFSLLNAQRMSVPISEEHFKEAVKMNTHPIVVFCKYFSLLE